MKTLTSAAVVTACAVLIALSANSEQTQTKPDTKAQAAPAELDKQYAKMQEQMQKMQQEMAKLRETQDPKERERLLQQHWDSMQSLMGMMHETWGGMMGPGMMGNGHMMGGSMMGGSGGAAMGGHMMGWSEYRSLTPEQLKERQYMMDRWLPMQQMMMDQMMQHQQWMMQPPPPAAPEKKQP